MRKRKQESADQLTLVPKFQESALEAERIKAIARELGRRGGLKGGRKGRQKNTRKQQEASRLNGSMPCHPGKHRGRPRKDHQKETGATL